MHIECPKCGFARDVPEEKLSPTAVKATCPKCRHKFRFRELTHPYFFEKSRKEPEAPAPGDLEAPEESPDATPDEATRETPEETAASPEADPQAEQSPTPEAGRQADAAGPDPDSAEETASSKPRPGKNTAGDIWDSLESLAPDEEMARALEKSAADDTGVRGEEESEAEPGVEAGTFEVPWERLDRYGFFGGLYGTIKLVLTRPQAFFAHMPAESGMMKPLIFYLLLAEFQILASTVWSMSGMMDVFMPVDTATPEAATPFAGMSTILMFLFYPLLVTAGLFIGAGLNHLMLLAVRGTSRGFEATFRAAAYAASPMVLSVVPFIGPILGAVWSFALTIIAYRHVHKTTYARVLLALLLPMLLIFGVLLAAVLLGNSGPTV